MIRIIAGKRGTGKTRRALSYSLGYDEKEQILILNTEEKKEELIIELAMLNNKKYPSNISIYAYMKNMIEDLFAWNETLENYDALILDFNIENLIDLYVLIDDLIKFNPGYNSEYTITILMDKNNTEKKIREAIESLFSNFSITKYDISIVDYKDE